MWFDSFALLPLVALGLLRLVNEGKYRLYVVSLALSVFTSFYMGIFICIFAALAFFGLCIIRKLNPRDFFGKLGLIAGCSALALGMAAVVLIPSYSALRNTYNAGTPFPAKPALYGSFFSIMGNFIAFTPSTIREGLPNLYCGMASVLLAGLYIYSAKVSRREKLVFAGTLVFLLVSCNLNMLDYILHGFRYPQYLPARFSFLISFILVVAAYRAFLLTESALAGGILAMGISAAAFLLAAVFGSQGKGSIIGSAVLCIVYLLILYFFTGTGTARGRTILRTMFLLVVLTELSITSYIAIKAAPLPDRNIYPDRYEEIQALLDMRRPSGDPSGDPSGELASVDFCRTDLDGSRTTNDPSLYNYNGISFFSSTANVGVSRFLTGLGLPGFIHNHYWYTETSPLTSAFLNMRYTIVLLDDAGDDSVYWETAGKAGDLVLLENKRYLPLGFMADEGITGYAHTGDPFLSQNDLFRRATGLDEDLFEIIDISALGRKGEHGRTGWSFKALSDEMIYAYCEIDRNEMMEMYNGDNIRIRPMLAAAPCIFTVGSFSQGDTILLSLRIRTGSASLNLGFLNSDLFERGYALLADETLQLTQFTDTRVSGSVTALKDGVLYTSIPGDKNWNVFVDGVKSKIVLIDNAMAAVRLSEGAHTVEFRYFNKSLAAGIIVSLASLAIFAALVLMNTLKSRKQGTEEK